MISQYKELNLLTSPFTGKSMQFLTNTNTLLVPSNGRVIAYSMDSNSTYTLPFHAKYEIKYIAISPDGQTLTAIDIQNNIMIVELSGNTLIYQVKSQYKISCIQYSPDGKLLGICRGNQLIVYKAPGLQKQLCKLEQIKKVQNKHSSEIKQMKWSPDSRFIITWGKDNSIIINSVFQLRLYSDIVFQAHKMDIIIAFFIGSKMRVMCTLDQFGKLCVWRWVTDFISDGYKVHQKLQKQTKQRHIHQNKQDEILEPYTNEETQLMTQFEISSGNGRFILAFKRQLKEILGKNFGRIKSAEYHEQSKLLILGQYSGMINLLRFDDELNISNDTYNGEQLVDVLQSFTATEGSISTICFNSTAEWIALGMRQLGQLIIWEWRSQTIILNQQCLSYETTYAAQSQDLIATGSVSGLIRLWNTTSNMCIARFDALKQNTEQQSHSSKITSLQFVPNKVGVLISTSLDGTARAFDTIRLKCFRTFSPPTPNQLQCLAIEPSGEIICAGGFDPYEIYCWQLQTGQLIEVISGHKAPVTQLCFSTTDEAILLISASWDKTIRMHDLYSRASRQGSGGDVLEHNSEITALAVRNDGKQIISATMRGELIIWDTRDVNILGTIDVDRDIQGGRGIDELISAQQNQNKKHFTSLVYSQDGNYVLGGGNSKYICMYDTRFRILLRKFYITQNLSLDGMVLRVDLNKIQQQALSDEEEQKDQNLPGSKIIDSSKRVNKRVHVFIHSIEFSSSNKQFIVSHSEGVSIFGSSLYSKNIQLFDPLLVDESITVDQIKLDGQNGNYLQALTKSLKLNVNEITLQVYNMIDLDSIQNIVGGIPEKLIPRLLNIIIISTQSEKHIQRDLIWGKYILINYGSRMNTNINILNQLIELQRVFKQQFIKVELAATNCINRMEYFKIQQQLKDVQQEIELPN